MESTRKDEVGLLKNIQANLSAAKRDFEAFLLLMKYLNNKQKPHVKAL
ncbi:MAG: hypothetical protein PHH75_05095 [Candidatus Omnitrophica bacterium]|nr:hypothetical protein [Candidatus Omnitrophota bacterium]MDD5574539.1 hypothetical protein [Candidatus Omnitrophota bacterium]